MASKYDLSFALKALGRQQHVIQDTHGNLSCRAESTDVDSFYIKPSGVPYEQIEAGDCLQIEMSTGRVTDRDRGRGTPSVDTAEHWRIYARHPSVQSICHTHSPYATAFAIVGKPIPVFSTEHADYFGRTIRCIPFSTYDEWGELELQLGESAVLLENHGTLICSRQADPRSAVRLAVALEQVAQKAFLASQLHASIGNIIDGDEAQRWHNRYWSSYGQR